MAKTFDGPPTLKRSGSEHRRAVTSPLPEEEGLGEKVELSLQERRRGRKKPSLMVKKDGLILENNTIMADKEVLEQMLSMLPEEFQDIYDDTIPEAKEIRKKMGKKVSSVKSYSCAMPMFEDIRKLNYKGQAKICKTFHQYLTKHPKVVSFFLGRFEETYSRINMKDLEDSIEWIGYAVNDMDNTISEIDYNDPMTFFDIEKVMGKVISKELKINSLK